MDIRQTEIQRLKDIKRKKNLTKEDLEFLYNIHYHIKDNDVYNEAKSMILKRDKVEDLSVIFNCSKDQIGFNEYELKEGKELKYFEALYALQHTKIKGYEELEQITFPDYFNGSIEISGVDDIRYKQFSKNVKGEIVLKDTKYMEDVVLPEKISFALKMRKLEKCTNVKFPKSIYGNLIMNKLETLDGIIIPENFEYNSVSSKFSKEDLIGKSKQKIKK